MKYEELPRACQMMLQYAGVEYLEEQHSPSMEDLPTWISDEELGYSSRPPPSSRPARGRRGSLDNISNNYDMDGKTSQTFVLVWALGCKIGLVPEDLTDQENCVALERELFSLMNRMTWMINKVCYTPHEVLSEFDDMYARTRFSRRCNLKLPNVNKLILGNFTTGETPCYVDFTAYAAIHDMKAFVPKCFKGSNNKPLNNFVQQMEELPQLEKWFEKEWFEGGGRDDAYIRPRVPSIETFLTDTCFVSKKE